MSDYHLGHVTGHLVSTMKAQQADGARAELLPPRLANLVEEFSDGADLIQVPLNQADLAIRWGISRGSVQDFLRRHERTGTVVSRSPLVIDIGPSRPNLRLVDTASISPTAPTGHGHDSQVDDDQSTQSSDLLDRCLDLMLEAAAVGDIALALALKQAVLTTATNQPAPDPRQTRADPRKPAPDPRKPAQTRALSSLEPEKKYFFSTSEDHPPAQTRARPTPPAFLPAQTKAVMEKRLNGKPTNILAECTFAWDRPGWSLTKWTSQDHVEINRFWKQQGFSCDLTSDALAALLAWSPTQASTAIKVLAGRTDTRNPAARLLAAAVWGYHSFFPTTTPPVSSQTVCSERLRSLSQVLQQMDRSTLFEHLDSFAENEAELLDRVALAIHLGILDLDDCAELITVTDLTTVSSHASHLGNMLDRSPS